MALEGQERRPPEMRFRRQATEIVGWCPPARRGSDVVRSDNRGPMPGHGVDRIACELSALYSGPMPHVTTTDVGAQVGDREALTVPSTFHPGGQCGCYFCVCVLAATLTG